MTKVAKKLTTPSLVWMTMILMHLQWENQKEQQHEKIGSAVAEHSLSFFCFF
jgi:hypothetical protein